MAVRLVVGADGECAAGRAPELTDPATYYVAGY
jgi:hypothetical protein